MSTKIAIAITQGQKQAKQGLFQGGKSIGFTGGRALYHLDITLAEQLKTFPL
jgi:hypothetical protein